MPVGLDDCIASIFEPGNPGSATDSGAITIPRYAINAAVAEAAAAVDAPSSPTILSAAVAEAASAADASNTSLSVVGTAAVTATAGSTQDATVVSGVVYATWDAATATNVTLSNGGLTAAHSNTTTNSGVRTASTTQKNSGKWYFEITCTTIAANDMFGIATPAATYTDVVSNVDKGAYVWPSAGNIYANGGSQGMSIGAVASTNIVGVAVDLDNEKVWFRKAPSGNWNGLAIGSQNPVGNVGGVTIAALSATTVSPVQGFSTSASSVITANFGASSFSGAVPSGFTSGWTA